MLSGGSNGSGDLPESVDSAMAGAAATRPISDPELARLVAAQEELTRRMAEYDTTHLNTEDRLALLVRNERVTRARIGQGHIWLAQLVEQNGFDSPGARNADALSLILNIDRSAATRRLTEARLFGDRSTLVGDRLDPELPTTAAYLRSGSIDSAHADVIRAFLRSLPVNVDAGTRADAEKHLAVAAPRLRPSELKILGERISAHIVEEGDYDLPPDRVRKRGIFLDKQAADGTISGRFVLDPETCAYGEAVTSKLAQPGMADPDDATPTVDGAPDPNKRDLRTRPQRLHDALRVVFRQMLASGDLGQHRGLPVTVIVTATGGFLPIRDVIRMASHAHHYLAIYDGDGCPLHLGRSKRIASEHQRIVLIGADRGCSAPGCDRPATMSQVHHIDEWQLGGSTDIESLTFACDRHHPMIHDGPHGWATSKVPSGRPYEGRTQWHPPAIVDPLRQGRVNHLHHAEDFLRLEPDKPPGAA